MNQINGCTVFNLYNVDEVPDVDVMELLDHERIAREVQEIKRG